MANMSYCRFENTARDLQDCVEAVLCEGHEPETYEDLSHTEKRGLKDLKALCESFLDAVEEYEEGGN